MTSDEILERNRWAGDNVRQLILERQTSLDRLFGIEHHAKIERTKGGLSRVVQGEPYPEGTLYRHFSSLQQAYVECSGDANVNYFGKCVRAAQNYALPSFEELLANTLNRALMRDYRVDYRWRDIVTAITGPRDFRQVTGARIKYVPDIPSLTEDQPYADLQTPLGDDEVVTYTINSTGCYISFTRRLLINDDIGAAQRAVAQLALRRLSNDCQEGVGAHQWQRDIRRGRPICFPCRPREPWRSRAFGGIFDSREKCSFRADGARFNGAFGTWRRPAVFGNPYRVGVHGASAEPCPLP